jgi:hypothetical protein
VDRRHRVIAGIGKPKAHRGDAETRRKTEIGKQSKTSPLIYTDDTDRRGYSGVELWKPFRILIE